MNYCPGCGQFWTGQTHPCGLMAGPITSGTTITFPLSPDNPALLASRAEVDALQAELATVKAELAEANKRIDQHMPVIAAALDYHWSEVAGNVIPHRSRAMVRIDFDLALEKYRTQIGLSGVSDA